MKYNRHCFLKQIEKSKRILLSSLLVIYNLSAFAFTDANSVYHEQSFIDIGCSSVKFMSTKTPTATTQVTIGWRILFQNLTDHSAIYYTTDGSAPSGAFGIGNGTTQVIPGQYICAYGSPKIDVIKAVMPAQPLGTVVKYIIGAWHSSGGDEVFANGVGTACNCGTPTKNSSLATIFSYNVDYLIDANGDGGFELGNTFYDNGWNEINSFSTYKPKWFLTNSELQSFTTYKFIPTGNRAAFISTNGTNWSTYPADPTACHLYKDVVLPQGKNILQLSFRWNCRGNKKNKLFVFICPTDIRPLVDKNYWGTDVTTWFNNKPNRAYFVGEFNLLNSGTGKISTISIPDSVAGNCNGGSAWRIVFTWVNQTTSDYTFEPPAAIDDISLKVVPAFSNLSSSGGIFSIDNTLPDGSTNFSSFSNAISTLNSVISCSSLTGPIIFNVAAGQEFFEDPPEISQSGTAQFPITFQKSGSGSNPIIKAIGGIDSDDAGITFLGADYIIFDGIDIQVNSSDKLEYGYLIKGKTSENGCKNIVVKNTNIKLNRNNEKSAGIFQQSLNSPASGNFSFIIKCYPPSYIVCDTIYLEEGNKANKFLNINIQNSHNGIVLVGKNHADLDHKYDADNVIGILPGGETKIGADYSGNPTGDISTYGIYTSGMASTEVSNCIIQNINSTGIFLTMSTGTNTIANNKIKGIRPGIGTAASGRGIEIEMDVNDDYTNKEKTNIFNNMISDVSNIGIRVGFASPASTNNIDFNSISVNSVNLNGNKNSSCLEIKNVNLSQNNIRNNILANFTKDQTGTEFHSIIDLGHTTSIGNSSSICNNNDYFIANQANGHIAKITSGFKTTLNDWKTAITGNPGIDNNTITVDPLFNNAKTDLTANAFAINNAANPTGITWVTTSIDGSPRSDTPDIGAKEFTPPPLDIAVIDLISPSLEQCYYNTETIKIKISNFSYQPLNLSFNPITLSVVVSGTVNFTTSKILENGTILPGEYIVVVMPDFIDMSNQGSYQFSISASMTGDVNNMNNSLSDLIRTVSPKKQLPEFLDFTYYSSANLGTIYSGWYEAQGFNTTPVQNETVSILSKNYFENAGNSLAITINSGKNSGNWVIGPKFLCSSETILKYKLAMSAQFSNQPPANGGLLGTVDDQFVIKISSDCGNSFQDLYTYNGVSIAGISNSLIEQSIDLSTYTGQECIIAFYASNGTFDDRKIYLMHLDDIFIGEPVVCNSMPDAGIITPALNTVCIGGNTTIAASGFSLANGISHQWQSSAEGIIFTDIPGATGTQLNTGGISSPQYFRMMTTCLNSGESDITNTVYIGINVAPAGNSLADPVLITGLPFIANGNNLTSNCWTSTYTGSNSNVSPDVFYKFTATCNGVLKISMCGGQFTDDALHLLNSAGTQLVYNTNGGPLCSGSNASIQYNSMTAGQTYYIVVEGTGSAQGNYILSITQVVSGLITYFQDYDSDGYGNPNVSATNCVPLPGYVTNDDDCNDNNPSIHLNAVEVCNGIDDDCDGLVDETTLSIAVNTSGISCYGQLATIYVTATGGEPPYTGTGIFTVGPGTYAYTVTDARGCSRSSTIVIQEPPQLTCSTTQTNATYWHANNCTATVYPSGGTPPYSYSWNTSPVQHTQTATKLQGGSSYMVTVTDAKGCTVQCTVLINEPVYNCSSIKDFTQADMGEWGAVPSGSNISNIWLYPYFSQVFPSGAVIGGFGRSLKFNCAQAITNFLSAGASPTQLPNANYINPKGSNTPTYSTLLCGAVGPVYKNTLASKTLALLLNTEFDKKLTGFTPTSNVTLGDLIYTSSPLTGWSVNQILNEVNRLLGEGLINGQTNTYYTTVLTVIDNILKGKNLKCPVELILTSKSGSDVLIAEQNKSITGLTISVRPNPSEHQFTLNIESNSNEKIELKVIDMYGRKVYSTTGTANRQYQFGNRFVSGAYVAEVRQGINRSTVKLIKQ